MGQKCRIPSQTASFVWKYIPSSLFNCSVEMNSFLWWEEAALVILLSLIKELMNPQWHLNAESFTFSVTVSKEDAVAFIWHIFSQKTWYFVMDMVMIWFTAHLYFFYIFVFHRKKEVRQTERVTGSKEKPLRRTLWLLTCINKWSCAFVMINITFPNTSLGGNEA